MAYPSQTDLKLKSRKISFVQIIHFICQIVLKASTEHGSDTAVLCANFQCDLTSEHGVPVQRDFARFDFNMCFGGTSDHIATTPTDSGHTVFEPWDIPYCPRGG